MPWQCLELKMQHQPKTLSHQLILTLILAFTGPFNCLFVFGQSTVIIDPNTAGGFESGTTWSSNGWTEVNGSQPNKWWIGTIATGFTGARCANIGSAATNNTYTNNVSVSHFYRDFTIPSGQPNVTLSFSWKADGELGFDFVKVYVVPTNTPITAGTQLTLGQIGTELSLSNNTWQNEVINLPCNLAGTTQRLVFSWVNNGSIRDQPPGCIDNVSLISSSNPNCSSLLGTGVVTVNSLPYNSGSGTTCGSGNDLNSINMVACGSNLYLGGEEKVWIFTPQTSGSVTIDLTTPNTSSWTGLMVYQGCPVSSTCGGAASGICIAQSQSASGNKSICVNVIAGQEYYLILDSYPSPACNDYNNLSISAPSGGSGSTPCSTLIGTGFTAVSSLPYNSGSGTTCGQVNDLTPVNTAACGATYYLDGEDRVWAFTPAATGQITIDLNAPTATYTGIMLYQGCPVTGPCGGVSNAICIAQSQSFAGSKSICVNVTANVTYYLVLDSWPSPACNPYTNLSISI